MMTNPFTIPAEIRPSVDRELQTGEKLLWFGQPRPGAYAAASIAMPIFGLFFGGFAIFWVCTAFAGTRGQGPIGIFFPLFGLPFVLVGLGMISSPLWLRKKARRTAYLLTDRRAVILEGGFFSGQTTYSYQPDRLTAIVRVERRSGSGDLIFEQFTTRCGSGHSTTRRGFIGIADVRQVEALVNQVVASSLRQRDGSHLPQ